MYSCMYVIHTIYVCICVCMYYVYSIYVYIYIYIYIYSIYVNYLLQWPPVILSIKNTYYQIARSESIDIE